MDFIRFMWEDGLLGKFMLILIIICIVLIPLTMIASAENNKKWELFKAERNCKIVSQKEGYTDISPTPVFTGKGMVMGITTNSTPSQTGWLCDDGITYFRNN